MHFLFKKYYFHKDNQDFVYLNMRCFRSYQIDSSILNMKIYSEFLFLLLIQQFSFVPINKDCFELNQRSLFLEQALMSGSPAGSGPCDVSQSCNVIRCLK